tara:strand:- start:4630 stop:4881 length:252 start_codon:yes stop_codon:yes gene_type:complete
MERIMNDASTIRTSMISRTTRSSLVIGDDKYIIEELWRAEDNFHSRMIWLEGLDGELLLVQDKELYDWLVDAMEAHERAEVPF